MLQVNSLLYQTDGSCSFVMKKEKEVRIYLTTRLVCNQVCSSIIVPGVTRNSRKRGAFSHGRDIAIMQTIQTLMLLFGRDWIFNQDESIFIIAYDTKLIPTTLAIIRFKPCST